MPNPLIQELAEAIYQDQLPDALKALKKLNPLDVVLGWIDDTDPVLYVAHRRNDRIHGATVLVEAGEVHVYSETESPPFTRCPPELIHELDRTLDVKAIAWRRDCLLRHHRAMAISSRLGHPPWTAFYCQEPLAQLQYPAHFAVVARSSNGRASLAVTDGHNHWVLEDPGEDLPPLSPLPELEWWQHREGLMAAKGRSGLHYVGLGPLEYRVGMLFNDMGGLITWSACAQDCQIMATLAGVTDDVFTPSALLAQLDSWLGRSSVAEAGPAIS